MTLEELNKLLIEKGIKQPEPTAQELLDGCEE